MEATSRRSNQYQHYKQQELIKQMEQKRRFDRRNKGGRPKKEAADKLKYRLTVKMATSDYYTLKGKARSAGISAGEFLRECMKAAM